MVEGSGKLAVIGGRLEDGNVAIFAELHRLAAGRILVFPTASSEPEAVGVESAQVFRSYSFETEIAPLTAANAATMAHDAGLIAQVAAVGSVYFTGGDQSKIVASLAPDGVETPLLAAIRAAHAGGGLVAGSSAGAAMMSQPMIIGGTSIESVLHGVTEDPENPGLMMGAGLGFFPFGLVDQHFIKRGRLGRLVVALAESGIRRGFGIDENTALLVEDGAARVCGEYGVMVVDIGPASVDRIGRSVRGFRLSYLDDGDGIELGGRFKARPGAGKRRVRRREMAYRAPTGSRRNAFGAYTIYDLMTRLVLADTSAYDTDRAEAFDARSGCNVTLEIGRQKRRSRALIATPESGLRMSALDFSGSLLSEQLSATRAADRIGRPARTFGMTPNPEARIALLGSSPMRADPSMLAAALASVRQGPVGVLAAASSEPVTTAREHVALLSRAGVQSIDLGINIDNLDYVEKDEDLLERIAGLSGILLCGGNQIRLVETLLHRGEESAVLRAIARAHSRGATLIAASGGAAALSGVMIAGGSSWEALRYGVSSDTGHRGLVIQEGIGLFGGGIVDQNMLSGNRLGRLIVACAEESERFGIGVFEDSAAIAMQAGTRIEAAGRLGFVAVEIDPETLQLQSDSFVAENVRVTALAPGDTLALPAGTVDRGGPSTDALLGNVIEGLARDAGVVISDGGSASSRIRGLTMRVRDQGDGSALIDIACPRDQNA